MFITAFKSLFRQLIFVCGLLAACSLVVWGVNGQQAALDLLDTTILRMKGPWVWAFGYGLASFIRHKGRLLPAMLNGIIIANETTAAAMARIERSTFHLNALRYTLPITLFGAFLTSFYGVPNKGISHFMIFVGICAIYYVAAFLLFHFVEIILAFNDLFESMAEVNFKSIYNPLHIENLTTYLALSTTLGVAAIYAGFRGTLTAGFEFKHDVWRVFLSTPLILFLPATLFYNYYPRYVLKKIVQHKVFTAMERLGSADEEKAKSLLQNLKECAFVNSQILPFLDYKSLPSYLIAIFFVLSLAYNNDPAVQVFVKFLASVGSK